MSDHAYLSASASARWIACPPSAKLCSQQNDRASPYAEEGSNAHTLCQYLIEKSLGKKVHSPVKHLPYYNEEMQEAADGYLSFVIEQLTEAKKLCTDPKLYVEERLDFSTWVPQGFGTGDCVILAEGLVHVIDFKYGLGVLVEADHNSQLMCYALGAIETYGLLYHPQNIKLSIYQPRRENISTWETTTDELLSWAEKILTPAAKLAYEGKGTFHAGEHCKFCKVKATCRARAEFNLGIAKGDFQEPAELANEEISAILPLLDDMTAWAADLKEYALQQAISGAQYLGYKLVAGRANRKYTDETTVAEIVSQAGFNPYEKKLLGITAMTKELGKKRFDELLSGYIIKPQGKPVLVPDTDKRPALSTAKNDFTEE